MKATLVLLGACILAPFAGGLAGASINTTPLQSAADPLATVPQHESDFTGNIAFGGFDIPDHYPLVTAHGTIPVEDLMFHGGLGRRYFPEAGGSSAGPGPSFVDDAPAQATDDDADDGQSRRAADIAALPALDQSAAPAPSAGLVPADPELPAAARGMLTSVALPAGGSSGAIALAQ